MSTHDSIEKTPVLWKSFFEDVTKRHAPEAKIVSKSGSWLMRAIGLVLKPFNPEFMTAYITTIGQTIYVPDDFSEQDEFQALSVIAHETQHIIDYKKNRVLFTLGYLFPQFLALFALLGVFGFFNPWMFLWFLSLGFLAPIPAPWRYRAELNGYRVSILMGRVIHHYSESEFAQVRDWIKNQMTTGDYYFTWPFPSKIEQDLRDESFIMEPRYQEILEFLRAQGKIV